MIAVGDGVTVGTAVGNIRQVSRLIGAAMPGGMIAEILYAPASAILFVSETSDQFVPAGMWSKTVWRSSAGIFMTILITWVLTDRTNAESH